MKINNPTYVPPLSKYYSIYQLRAYLEIQGTRGEVRQPESRELHTHEVGERMATKLVHSGTAHSNDFYSVSYTAIKMYRRKVVGSAAVVDPWTPPQSSFS